jgi:hypothetical protein
LPIAICIGIAMHPALLILASINGGCTASKNAVFQCHSFSMPSIMRALFPVPLGIFPLNRKHFNYKFYAIKHDLELLGNPTPGGGLWAF